MSDPGRVVYANEEKPATAKAVYILYVVGWVIPVIAPIVGVIMAYINRDDAPAWLQTHYQFQIRTFWIGMLFGAISVVTTAIYIGWVLMLLTLIWMTVRCVTGLTLIQAGAPYLNSETWLWGGPATNAYHSRPQVEPPTLQKRSVRDSAERAVLRDIWIYAGMLFGVGSVITVVFSGFAPLLVWPVFMMLALACFFGALILHLDTLERWARARRKGEKPELQRIFD